MTAFVKIADSGTQHLTANQVSTGDPLVSDPIDMTVSGGANCFFVCVGYYPHQGGQDSKLLQSVTDSAGNHYSRVRGRTGANNNLTTSDVVELWYTDGAVVNNGVAMTFTADFAGATFGSISIAGFRAPALPISLEASNEGFGSGLALDGGNVTTLDADRLIIGAGTHTGVTFLAGGFTAGTNMTDCGEYDQSSTTSTSYLNFRLAATAGTYASPETANGSSNAWASQTGAFKAGLAQTSDVGSARNRPGRGPYSLGKFFIAQRLDAFTASALTSYTLGATAGTYALTGQATALRAARQIAAAQGSYALNGQTVGLKLGHVVAAAQGTYSLTGQAVRLAASRRLAAVAGAYALNGQTVRLARGALLLAAQGAYALNGQAARLAAARRLTAVQGAYNLTGEAVGLLYSGSGSKILTAGLGTYALTGQATGLRASRSITAVAGAYSLTGQAAGFLRGRRLLAAAGAYGLSGQTVAFLIGNRKLLAASGTYTLTGRDVGLVRGLSHAEVLTADDLFLLAALTAESVDLLPN